MLGWWNLRWRQSSKFSRLWRPSRGPRHCGCLPEGRHRPICPRCRSWCDGCPSFGQKAGTCQDLNKDQEVSCEWKRAATTTENSRRGSWMLFLSMLKKILIIITIYCKKRIQQKLISLIQTNETFISMCTYLLCVRRHVQNETFITSHCCIVPRQIFTKNVISAKFILDGKFHRVSYDDWNRSLKKKKKSNVNI